MTEVKNAEAPANGANESTEDTRSKRQVWREGSTVRLTEKGRTNPKKPNSQSAARYDILLKTIGTKNQPVSVAALFKAGYRMDDIRHDAAHGFIELVEIAAPAA
jgi:hypothetical protein